MHPTGVLHLPDKEKNNINTKSKTYAIDVENGMGGVSLPINEETIGEHFGVLPNFDSITDGELNTETTAWGRFEGDGDLLDACRGYIREFADQPYRGRVTNQRVMDAGAKRYGSNTPPSWFKVIYLLKDSPGPSKVPSVAQQAAASAREEAERMWSAFGVVPDGNGGWKKPDPPV